MRLKLTLTLFAILIGLLTYIFYIDTRVDDGDFAEQRSNILGDLAIGIDHLSIHNNTTGQSIALKLQNKRWMLAEPYAWPANKFAVDRILTELRFLERISSFETDIESLSGVSLNDYGLRPPQLSLSFGRGEQSATIGIGKPTEIGNNLYILSPDKALVHVVDRSLLDAISVDLDSLRSPRLFDSASFEVTSWNIQVRENNQNLRAWFARNGDKWLFQTPIRARADSAEVNALLERCLNLEAQSVVASNPSDLSPYGLQTSLYRIAVETAKTREVLEIGDRISPDSDIRYAKRESRPAVFQLRIDFLDHLAMAQTRLRERRILEVDATAATTVTIEKRDTPPLTLQKLENGNWEIVTRNQASGIQTRKGDPVVIAQTLQWLNELKAVPETGFVNDAPSAPDLESYGLEVPEYSVSITANKRIGEATTLATPITETLSIGDRSRTNPQQSFVKLQSKDFVYSVYNDIFEQIDINPLRFEDRQVLQLSSGERFTRIQLTRIADQATLADFDFTASETPPAEAQAIASQLESLKVESYRTEGFTRTVRIAGRDKPWAYELIATIDRNGAAENSQRQVRLLISETTGGPLLFGALAERNVSFRFRIEFIDTFTPLVFDREVRPKPEEPFSDKPLPNTTTAETRPADDIFTESPPRPTEEIPAQPQPTPPPASE